MDIIEKLIERFRLTLILHHKVLDRELEKVEVHRSQHRILMFLSDHRMVSQIEIAKADGVSTATVAVCLKKLERDGYITKVVDEKDNRFNKIDITEKGLSVVKSSKEIFVKVDSEMFEGFEEEEKENMLKYLEKIYKNLQSK